MRRLPKGYGGERRPADEIKREGWLAHGILAVAAEDGCLTWPERELVRQLGERLYGRRSEPRGDSCGRAVSARDNRTAAHG